MDAEEYIVKVPQGLKHLHVLMEPMSCAAKAIQQAFEAQQRMKVWRPQRAFVLGAGQIGLLSTLVLKNRGLDVYTLARSAKGTLNSEIVEGLEATYVSTRETPIEQLVEQVGKADLIVDATGHSGVAFDAMNHLGHNGVLVWTSITGGDRAVEIPSEKINIEWVLSNKLLVGTVNANKTHFESGIRDLALGEVMYPGVLERILTNPIDGFENYQELMRLLVEEPTALKVYMNVSE